MAVVHQNNLGRALVRFFQDYLPNQRGMSTHTIRSYRDAIVLFLRFASQDAGRGVERLEIGDLRPERVTQFLANLESERGNGIATRNARLAALHTLARFLATEHPQHMGTLQALLAVPFKRGAKNAPIEYLEHDEVREFLDVIDRSDDRGRRDYALFALMFNTGARVQEILDLRARDVRLDAPAQVRLTGKGNKIRVCPIWATTASLLRPLCTAREGAAGDLPLFVNQRGQPLTRFGVRYLLQRHLADAASRSPTLANKSIHPHSIRHTTAIHLLKAGVDFASISQWLGHASLNTTMVYARADLDLKRQAAASIARSSLSSKATLKCAASTSLNGRTLLVARNSSMTRRFAALRSFSSRAASFFSASWATSIDCSSSAATTRGAVCSMRAFKLSEISLPARCAIG